MTKATQVPKRYMYNLILSIIILLFTSPLAFADEVADENKALRQSIKYLEQELKESREKLTDSKPQAVSNKLAEPKKSPIRIGGAMRVNHTYGDYSDSDRRSENIGDSGFELLRLNADLDYGNVIGRAEYRHYDNYSMMHTAWLGYKSNDYGTLKAGIVRVPFGPGPYGVSSSWFFDQHYYVGLTDDMDLGIRWMKPFGNLTVDLAYYLEDEGHWDGSSRDSARYSYDPVKWNSKATSEGVVTGEENGFEEKHQLNLRLIYATESIGGMGMSFQYGGLEGTNVDDSDAYHLAASAHAVTPLRDFALFSQVSYYKYGITDDTPWGTGDLIPMGAFDFAWPVASEAWVTAVSLRYKGLNASNISWLDSVTPYIEWSSILKDRDDFNNSSLWVLGALWYWSKLYISTDFAVSDGNYFVGNKGDNYSNIYDGVNDFGASGNNRWHKRFNVNLGYYFNLYE